MRRVYYAYSIKLATHPVILHGILMIAFLIALTYYVSIRDIINNVMNIEVGHLGTYAYNAVTNTEIWTLFLVGAFIFSLLSLRFKLHSKVAFDEVQTVSI